MEKRIKILVSAYACEPNLGSEIGVGWHWVLEMSKYFDLWVLTRESNRASIEAWLEENSLEHCPTFVYYDLPKKWRFWKRGLRGVRLYYTLWQKLTNSIVKRTMEENDISVYHLLTYGNALWTVSKYGQRQDFIWGPTSAGSYVPSDYTRHYGWKSRLKEFAQRVMAHTLRFNYSYRRRCRNAKLILCKTEQTLRSLPARDRHKGVVFTDVAIGLFDRSKYVDRSSDGITRYLAVGRLDAWRGFDVMIEAFARALQSQPNLHLDILGKGSDASRLEQLIARFGVQDKVCLRGQVSIEEYYTFMAQCDVVVNPTLKEGAVTTAFDSMSFAKPLICIDSAGYTRYFNNDYAVVLALSSRADVLENLCGAMLKLRDVELRKQMSDRIIAVRDNFTWERKGKQIRDIITRSLHDA